MNKNDEWVSVPQGTFRRVAAELPAEQQGRSLKPYGVGAVLGVLLAAMIFGFSLLNPKSQPVAPASTQTYLTCAEVLPILSEFHSKSLSHDRMEGVQAHLAKCDACNQTYQEQFGVAVRMLGQPTSMALLAGL